MNLDVMPHTSVSDIAALCKALGDPMRAEIIRVLAQNSYGVLELAEIFEATQPRISHHLKILSAAGLVSTRREGSAIFYRRAPLDPGDTLAPLKQRTYQCLDQCNLSAALRASLEQVHVARAAVSSRFFVDNAEKFRAQQDLIASYPIYSEAITELLDASPVHSQDSALEIGPGDGEFLAPLAKRFMYVTGVDTSAQMLNQARALCDKNDLGNVTLILGEASDLPSIPQFDCAAMNMVLHHTPAPADLFRDIAKRLKPKGVVLITELCSHDQSWAREACGDIWLGFESTDIDRWALDAGFQVGQSQFLALRNGFQIQLKQFSKP